MEFDINANIDEKMKALIDENSGRGGNCAQSTCLAFADKFNIDKKELMVMAAPFGGGMGYFGLTCGALAGAGMVFSNRFGSDFLDDKAYKGEFYKAIKEMCQEFEDIAGASTCGEFMRMKDEGKKRPTCRELTYLGAILADKYIKKYEGVLKERN